MFNPLCDDGTLQANDDFKTVCRLARHAYKKTLHTTSTKELQSLLEAAGLENVRRKQFKVPKGPWESNEFLKDVGRDQEEAMLEFIRTLAARPFQALG